MTMEKMQVRRCEATADARSQPLGVFRNRDDDPSRQVVCTLPYGHNGYHVAEDVERTHMMTRVLSWWFAVTFWWYLFLILRRDWQGKNAQLTIVFALAALFFYVVFSRR